MEKAKERSGSLARTLVAVLIVLGVLLPAGYFGLTFLRKEIQIQQAQTRSVIIELNAATVEAVRADSSKAVTEIKKLDERIASGPGGVAPEGGGAAVVGAAALKKSLDDIQTGQKDILKRLDALGGSRPVSPKAAPAPERAPGTHPDRLNRTIHFPLAVFKGPEVDAQVAKILAEMKSYANGRRCVVNVMGFSDTLGNDAANLKLSQERADHIATMLEAQGVAVTNVKGWGERWLEVHTLDGVKKDQNRRVVIEMDCAAAASPPPAAPAATKSTS